MEYYQLKMKIIEENEGIYTILIIYNNAECRINFSPKTKKINYIDNNQLSIFIKLKEFQLRKILHNKKPESFYIDFKLNFILNNSLPEQKNYDRTKITSLDNTNNKFIVKKIANKTKNIPELFTDGSYNHEKNIGGFAILIKTVQNKYLMNQVKTTRKGNNLIELLAVIEGLKYLKDENKIRLVTDSQYVIKGITEWLPIWKINNFYTANGTKAKNISEWKNIDISIRGKYMEFEWVKAHSDHFENTICDMKAKLIYNNK